MRCGPPPCPTRHWRPTPNGLNCSPNSANCETAEDTTGNCLTCDTLYEVLPNFTCGLIPCTANQWRQTQTDNTCAANPPLCTTAADGTGFCTVADPGYYVLADQSIVQCSTIDINCAICRNGDGLCSTCNTNFEFNTDFNQCIYRCPGFTSQTVVTNDGCYNCNTLDTNCSQCLDLAETCTGCATGFKLADPIFLPKLCVPDCESDEYIDLVTNSCKPCPVNCTRCADITGICQQCISSTIYYIDEDANECFRRCESNEYRTDSNTCLPCIDNCIKCTNSTSVCTECQNNFHINGTMECQVNCLSTQGWVEPNNCENCGIGCTSCSNNTLSCNFCDDYSWLDTTVSPQDCKVKCTLGRFTPLTDPNYVMNINDLYQAWVPPNDCQECLGEC